MTRRDEIRARLDSARAAVGLGTTCYALAQLVDDIEWLLRELEGAGCPG